MRIRLLACLLASCGSNGSKPDAAIPDARPYASPDGPPGGISGLVTISQLRDAMGAHLTSNATAQFVAGSSIYGTTVGSDGGCMMFENPPTVGLSAGTIVIDGTTGSVTLTPTGSPTKYSSSTVPDAAFTAGAALTFASTGADVPPFSDNAVVAPSALAGFTPPATMSRAAGFQATWTAGTGQTMWLFIVAKPAADAFVLLCRVPDSGSFLVTPAALAMFPAAATSVVVTLVRVGEDHLNLPGGGAIDFEAFDGVSGTITTLNP